MTDISIRPFEPKDRNAFKNISLEWIGKYFVLEKKDILALETPQESILDKGGYIFMAFLGNEEEAVGCCALLPLSPNNEEFEVAKMGLLERCRGLGLGKKLMVHVIEQARQMGAKRLYLESNDVLTPALRLYESVGFKHIPKDKIKPSPYQRCNVYMDMILSE